jgi:hypothetical protein
MDMSGRGKNEDQTSLPWDLSDDLGEIYSAEEECPGVWYVSVEMEGSIVGAEYYIIEPNAPCLSAEARKYGEPLPHHPELLAIELLDPTAGRYVVKYEMLRYLTMKNLPLPEDESLLEIAVYGMELNPEYFGKYPVPRETPHGYTTRFKELMNGMFFLETDRCEAMLSVCYPIWNSDLSEYTVAHGVHTAHDLACGVDHSFGYLFFPEDAACLVIFEILPLHPELIEAGTIDPHALKNAIWMQFPEYAALYNLNEQAGLNDTFGLLSKEMGIDIELVSSADHMISWAEGIGTKWLNIN